MDEQCLDVEESTETSKCGNDNEPESRKRPIKLTAKALAERLDSLQGLRKTKLNKAHKIIETIKTLMHNDREYVSEVQKVFENFNELCLQAREAHDSLLKLLPDEECEKHDIWFKAKLIAINEFREYVNVWLSESVSCQIITDNAYDVNVNDDVVPEDSVSNVVTACSRHSSKGGSSSTSSARVHAEAERAALVARAAALKTKHAIEAQQEDLRKRMEQLELDAEIAATNAKIAVLSTIGSHSKRSHVASSHIKGETLTKDQTSKDVSGKGITNSTRPKILNPQANEWVPMCKNPKDTTGYNVSLPPFKPTLMQQQGANTQQQSNAFQQRDFHYSVQPSNSNMTTDQATSTLSLQREPLYEILKKQGELTEYLVHQAQPNTLPKQEIPIFDGNPLHYVSFMRAFEHGVENRTSCKKDCLELVRSCQHLAPDVGYSLAKRILREQFGDEYKIATAYMEKVLGWPLIKTEDAQGLYAYSLFLRACCNIINDVSYMQELNLPSNMRTVVSKLPFKLRERWRERACEIMELNKSTKMASDPVFGCIQDKQQSVAKTSVTKSTRGNSFTTSVVSSTPNRNQQHGNLSVYGTNERKSCLFCQGNHDLAKCYSLKRKSQREKIDFLKGKGVCFGCLKSGHVSKECDNRLVCEVCEQVHPTILHIHNKAPVEKSSKEDTEKKKGSVSAQTCGNTGAGNERCLLSIVPVQVKAVKGDKLIQTYAFLDPGSSATFCTEKLMNDLNIRGRKNNIFLRTMGQEQSVSCNAVTGLEISGIGSNSFFPLPEVYKQKKMPVNSDNIITQKELSKWPYLDRVNIPHIEASVDLLIGINASQVMEPWEIINSYGNGPYAVRTLLGWAVNGLSEKDDEHRDEIGSPTVKVNRISIGKLEHLLHCLYNQDFNENLVDKKEMSIEDRQFIKIMNDSVAKEEVDLLRFLWWSEGDLKQELTTYRMIAHLFGAVSSPSCACFALRRAAEDNQSQFPSEVVKTVFDCFYVDDCLKSVSSEEEAIAMVKDLSDLCQRGGFCLTKWISNDRKVLQSIPEEHRNKDIQHLDLDRDQLPVERTLGLHWCTLYEIMKSNGLEDDSERQLYLMKLNTPSYYKRISTFHMFYFVIFMSN
ncbi:hypothetical protein IRJ41_010024 [Triplophysa rosa]|uniref:CCHC-type domain-containing protein n=1 Tax=Triplophysa rosa TaxID=992332 RepID=A0A9W7X3Z2_TRIRA|nr:hypothetical protein IRJ41_010024 [Triplophysa rosa]